MRLHTYTYPESSFLSLEKDMNLIVDMILKNERLKKMLFYTTKDCLSKPELTEDQSIDLFGKNIKIIPKLTVDGEVLNYLVISFDNFISNNTNPEFRDNVIEFDIVCHFNQWQLSDFELRPYKIAAELDSMFNNKRLTGIGDTEFIGASQMVLTDEYAGLCLTYRAVHGEEDKQKMPNPKDQDEFERHFDTMFNNK